MHGRLYRYLHENWGAPFVVAFILLFITSAVELSLGYGDAANGIAIYAFYSLVIGVVLQIASYVKYGEGTPAPEPLPASPPIKLRSRRTLAIVGLSVALVVGGSLAAAWFYYDYYPSVSLPVTSVLTVVSSNVTTTYGVTVSRLCPGCAAMSLTYVDAHSSMEPNGSVLATFTVSVLGGSPPYSFSARWGDGFNQTSTTGAFQRFIPSNETLAYTAVVIVSSSDGQRASITVAIPRPS